MSIGAGNEDHPAEPSVYDISLRPDANLAALLAGAVLHPDILAAEVETTSEADILHLPQDIATPSKVLANSFLQSAQSEKLSLMEGTTAQLEKLSQFAYDFLHNRAVATIAARRAIQPEQPIPAEISPSQVVTSRPAVLRYLHEAYEARRILPDDPISQARAQHAKDISWAAVIANVSLYPELRETIQLHKEMDRRGLVRAKDGIAMLISAQGARLAHLHGQRNTTVPPNSGGLRRPTL